MFNKDLRALARTDNVSDLPLFRALGDIPSLQRPPELVKVVKARVERRMTYGSYEEANWDRLSPLFREAHNKLRATRGHPPIPPPAVDRYVPPPPSVRRLEWDAETGAAARQFSDHPMMGMRGGEGISKLPDKARKILGE